MRSELRRPVSPLRRPRTGVFALAALALLVGAMPLAVVATVLLTPVWSVIEDRFGIEAVGHSGPAAWCFLATYVAVVAATALVAALVLRPAAARGGRTG